MKSYRNAAASLALTLVLATSAFAGEIHTGLIGPDQQPTPTTSNTTATATTDAETQTGVAASIVGATDAVTQTALNLLQSVLSLF
ncbi:MAG: hypothetical protein WCD76_14355 [Pyrinomonadaceae bacterium]